LFSPISMASPSSKEGAGAANDYTACGFGCACAEQPCVRVVFDFTHWTLKLHSNQGVLGRSLLFCKRCDALDVADAFCTEVV